MCVCVCVALVRIQPSAEVTGKHGSVLTPRPTFTSWRCRQSGRSLGAAGLAPEGGLIAGGWRDICCRLTTNCCGNVMEWPLGGGSWSRVRPSIRPSFCFTPCFFFQTFALRQQTGNVKQIRAPPSRAVRISSF